MNDSRLKIASKRAEKIIHVLSIVLVFLVGFSDVSSAYANEKKQADYVINLMGHNRSSLDGLTQSAYYEDRIFWIQINVMAKRFSRMHPDVFSAFKDLESQRPKKGDLSFRQVVDLFRRAREMAFENKKKEILDNRQPTSEKGSAADLDFVKRSTLDDWRYLAYESAQSSCGLPLFHIALTGIPEQSDILKGLEAAAKKTSDTLFVNLRDAVKRTPLGIRFLTSPARIVSFYSKQFSPGTRGYLNPVYIKPEPRPPKTRTCARGLRSVSNR